MKQIFAIGKEQVEISIPDENVMDVLHANLPEIPLDEQKTIKDALENPEAFEIPENDIQFLMGLGLKEIDLRGNNKKCPKKGRGIKNDSKE